MLFTEPLFLLFFIVVFSAFWILKSNELRKGLLLVASYTFYAAWDWRFLFLIIGLTAVNFVCGAVIGRALSQRTRLFYLVISLVSSLSVLGFFKYFHFFADSLITLSSMFDMTISPVVIEIVLPVGISFYTFQTLSYVLDIYRKQLKPTASILDFSLFVAFFPQLVAGPIVRAVQFLPQLETAATFARIPFKACFLLFLLGFFKKTGIADNIDPLIKDIFISPAKYQLIAIIGAVLLFAVQIYCDFSGYSDMAIAVAGVFGYRLPLNFNYPYIAGNLQDFWRRWHITLSTWFRDYLYIPLGGSRCSSIRLYINVLLTMAIAGLWHGASWNFILWGGLHGVGLMIFLIWSKIGFSLPRIISMVLTGMFVCLCWIFFRAENLDIALQMIHIIFGMEEAGKKAISFQAWKYVLPVLWGLHYLISRVALLEKAQAMNPYLFAALYGVAASLAFSMVGQETQPFIYFQF